MMTFGKLKELLDGMSEKQLRKEVMACDDSHGEHTIMLHIKDVRILKVDDGEAVYPALVA
jgi:hypothetical protein